MSELEIKSFDFEVKATADDTFEGYASVFGNVDSHRDIMEKGAFNKTIKENKDRVKILWQHDLWTPIGKPTHMVEDSKGLHVKGKISQTDTGRNALILMKDGVLDELSVGFKTIKDEWDKKDGIRRIKEVKLFEFSLVTFASNEMANITAVKSGQAGLERLLLNLSNELKTGKLLNSKSENLVKDAIEALQALMEVKDDGFEPPKGTQTLSDDEQKAADDINKLLAEMRNFKF